MRRLYAKIAVATKPRGALAFARRGNAVGFRTVPETASPDRAALVVDLDGSLVATDLLHESALLLAKHHPLDLLWLPFWLARGKARLKTEIAERVLPDVTALPVSRERAGVHPRGPGRRMPGGARDRESSPVRRCGGGPSRLFRRGARDGRDDEPLRRGEARRDPRGARRRAVRVSRRQRCGSRGVGGRRPCAMRRSRPARSKKKLVASGKMGRIFVA